MTLEDLSETERAEVIADEALWLRAHEIVARHPGLDVSGVHHALVNLRPHAGRAPREEPRARPCVSQRGGRVEGHVPEMTDPPERALTDPERRFLLALEERGVRYLVIGALAFHMARLELGQPRGNPLSTRLVACTATILRALGL